MTDEKLPLRRAESAPRASLRRITLASDKSTSRAAASRVRTPPRVSWRTWKATSGEGGKEPTKTVPSLLSHQRRTATQLRGKESQVITATWATALDQDSIDIDHEAAVKVDVKKYIH
jgi:hypothetical protein